ncbi:hypothetical protein Rcae01_05621 [Novipirellula caenicola]|uniref:Uncharacterized protein n=1 Tax=Novipirellula caenicola TaxID=1536901 RepID=A0ABP9VZX0_9BACT
MFNDCVMINVMSYALKNSFKRPFDAHGKCYRCPRNKALSLLKELSLSPQSSSVPIERALSLVSEACCGVNCDGGSACVRKTE